MTFDLNDTDDSTDEPKKTEPLGDKLDEVAESDPLEMDRNGRVVTCEFAVADTDRLHGLMCSPEDDELLEIAHAFERSHNATCFVWTERELGYADHIRFRVFAPHHADIDALATALERTVSEYRHQKVMEAADDK